MDRTAPKTTDEAIQLYMQTYYSLLRSSDMIKIETLIESHIATASALHIGAALPEPDVSALIYAGLRLPWIIREVKQVLIGQVERSFIQAGFRDVKSWKRVFAPGRRRRMHFNGDDTLLFYVTSRSDIDDLIPILTAYQIEWNKLHNFLVDNAEAKAIIVRHLQDPADITAEEQYALARFLRLSPHDLRRLETLWGPKFWDTIYQIMTERKALGVRMISASVSDYRKGTANWWEEIRASVAQYDVDIERHPVYFVSSNTHSLINLLTGVAQQYEADIVRYISAQGVELSDEYESVQQNEPKSLENFLYYVLRDYLKDKDNDFKEKLDESVKSNGIYRVPNKHGFEIESQIIRINRLASSRMDSRLSDMRGLSLLQQSEALIINIDYPLGMAAYEFLSRISERVVSLLGVYVIGKAATLNGRIGDMMIPNVIHDEHSQNTYLFNNCFSAKDLAVYMNTGNVLDNQKAVTVLGTFLQNLNYMRAFYQDGFTDVEMEGGPYLSAVYEAFRPKRHPSNEIVNLYLVPFDLGFLHYASDTPMKQGHNLGAGSLQYLGIESTYAAAIAVLRRIFSNEIHRIQSAELIPTF
ncbi:hypothetical protein MASR2M15_13530 [Anaerolineales bacterium]